MNLNEELGKFFFNGGYERALLERRNQEKEDKVLRDTVNKYIIDSCYTFDAGYETAIMKNGGYWIIVERYNNYNEMKEKHQKWCEFCKTNPKSVYSVQTQEEVILERN